MLRMSAPIMSGLAIMAHMAIADHAWSSEKPALTSFLPWPFIEKVEPIGSMSDRQCRVSLPGARNGAGMGARTGIIPGAGAGGRDHRVVIDGLGVLGAVAGAVGRKLSARHRGA